MNGASDEPRLYGIVKSNRTGDDLWGKNQFNSTFPVSLACYMRDKGQKAVYLRLNKNLKVEVAEISFDEVFNSKAKNEDLDFCFESQYDPCRVHADDEIGNIDLVIKSGSSHLRPLEIKLTVVPDSTTQDKPEDEWGAEMVIRPASAIYCALGIAGSCRNELGRVRGILEPVCGQVQGWDNRVEIGSRTGEILNALDEFEGRFYTKQKPFLMQPIWKTRGKTPFLAENAFDVFIWSGFAITRLFLDGARRMVKKEGKRGKGPVHRLMRSSARFARFLNEVSKNSKPKIKAIYTEMAHDRQTDKEFSVSGQTTSGYMRSSRLTKPALKRTVLTEIILGGGEKKLSPERRFDQTVYFTASELFKSAR